MSKTIVVLLAVFLFMGLGFAISPTLNKVEVQLESDGWYEEGQHVPICYEISNPSDVTQVVLVEAYLKPFEQTGFWVTPLKEAEGSICDPTMGFTVDSEVIRIGAGSTHTRCLFPRIPLEHDRPFSKTNNIFEYYHPMRVSTDEPPTYKGLVALYTDCTKNNGVNLDSIWASNSQLVRIRTEEIAPPTTPPEEPSPPIDPQPGGANPQITHIKTLKTEVIPGEEVPIEFTIVNKGESSTTYLIEAYLKPTTYETLATIVTHPTSSSLCGGMDVDVAGMRVTLGPGESQTYTLSPIMSNSAKTYFARISVYEKCAGSNYANAEDQLTITNVGDSAPIGNALGGIEITPGVVIVAAIGAVAGFLALGFNPIGAIIGAIIGLAIGLGLGGLF